MNKCSQKHELHIAFAVTYIPDINGLCLYQVSAMSRAKSMITVAVIITNKIKKQKNKKSKSADSRQYKWLIGCHMYIWNTISYLNSLMHVSK